MPTFLSSIDLQTIIDIFAIVISVALGFVLFFLQRKKKELSCEVIQTTPLFSINDKLAEDLAVTYQNNKIRNLYLLEIRISNSGNTPIKPDDFVKELSFSLPMEDIGKTWIVKAEIIDTKPKDLEVPFTKISGSNTIIFSPILMNKGDAFTLKLLIGGFTGKYKMSSRIVEVGDIITKKNNGIPLWVFEKIVSLVAIYAFALSTIALYVFYDGTNTVQFVVAIVVILVLITILSGVDSLLSWLFRKRK